MITLRTNAMQYRKSDGTMEDIGAIIGAKNYEFLNKTSFGAVAKLSNTMNTDLVTMKFDSTVGNRVYCGGKNLFNGEIGNYALAAPSGVKKVLTASNYRGFYVPIKGGLSYTISRDKATSNRFQCSFTSEVPANEVELITSIQDMGTNSLTYTRVAPAEAKYLVVYLSNQSEDVSDTRYQVEIGEGATSFVEYCGNLITTNENYVTSVGGNGNTVCWCDSGNIDASTPITPYDVCSNSLLPSHSATGNFSIVCAKERTYNDGTSPKIEYYLLEECGTQRFYLSRNLTDKQYIFTFDGEMESYNYAFGITNAGDIIAFALSDALDTGKDDAHRKNPYCWLAGEMWKIQHEVEFGDALKPCGWISNCGFRNLPNGDAVFCEYTRTTVATANVWKLSGDPSVSSNYKVVKQFEVTTTDNISGFKHIHTVQYDHFTGVVYFSTGDDDYNAMVWYSTDNGETWTQLGSPSQKNCRNLNYIFTEQYIYFSPDSNNQSARYVLRAVRQEDGVLDFDSIEDYINIYDESVGTNPCCYGLSYLREINALLILDRYDAERSEIPLKIADLNVGTCAVLTTLTTPGNEAMLIGFRTRYSEWYPTDCIVHFGFSFRRVGQSDATNHFKGFGNAGLGVTGNGMYNINNLSIRVNRIGDDFTCAIDTNY